MAEPIKRYDLITRYRCGDSIEELEPAEDGEWVRWEDVAAESQRFRVEIEKLINRWEEIEKLISKWDKRGGTWAGPVWKYCSDDLSALLRVGKGRS
jgi:hypothetical protein